MAFATTEDVEARSGGVFNDTQRSQVEKLLDDAQAVIVAELNPPDEVEVETDELLRGISCTLVLRAMANPRGVASESVNLGSYSRSQRFSRFAGGLMLTDTERLLLRRHTYGTISGTSRPESVVEEMHDHIYGDQSDDS